MKKSTEELVINYADICTEIDIETQNIIDMSGKIINSHGSNSYPYRNHVEEYFNDVSNDPDEYKDMIFSEWWRLDHDEDDEVCPECLSLYNSIVKRKSLRRRRGSVLGSIRKRGNGLSFDIACEEGRICIEKHEPF